MERRWSVRDDIFDREDGLWWLNDTKQPVQSERKTPMSVALKNGNISGVIDVKLGGLASRDKKRGYF